MPGLVGFIGDISQDEANLSIEKMASALHDGQKFRKDLFSRDGIGLGRVSLGIVNPEPQPIWNSDRSICIMMEGEIFDHQQLKNKLIDRRHNFSVHNDPEFILHLYEEYGEGFAEKLNGSFLVVIWDKDQRKLLIANDRIGLHPLYYSTRKGFFSFASGVRALLVDPAFPRSVDKIGLAEYLTFDHMISNRTLLESVSILPPGSILTYQDEACRIKSYWKVEFQEYTPLRDEQEYIQGLAYHLKKAVKRQSPGDIPAGVLLSGGLDSRVILAFLRHEMNESRLHTFTFGIPGCNDARYAKQASRVAQTQHHFYPLLPDYLLSKAQEGVMLTDGMENCIHMHALATLREEAESAKIIYKGFMGDALMGYAITRPLWASFDKDNLAFNHFKQYRSLGVTLFAQEQLVELLSPSIQRELGDIVFERFRSALLESCSSLPANQLDYFVLRYRVPRMTLNGVELVRSRAVVRLPFCDNDLVDFMLKVPPGLRYKRYLMKQVFIKAFPEMAKISTTETHAPLVPCMRDSLIRMDSSIRWYLRNHGLKSLPLKRRLPYADYNGWMRMGLRSWVEKILLDQVTLERGYFQPQAVRNLVSEHMSGVNNADKLGVLISLELWHRLFLDKGRQ
jgi:asparagine synthase (glutamine-hydrolysing)